MSDPGADLDLDAMQHQGILHQHHWGFTEPTPAAAPVDVTKQRMSDQQAPAVPFTAGQQTTPTPASRYWALVRRCGGKPTSVHVPTSEAFTAQESILG